MAAEFTKSSLDRVGARLRKAEQPEPGDAAAYLQYRDEFTDALREVEEQLATLISGSLPTGRRKTLDTVVAKLKRQKTRLSTMQDIAGCRIVVPGIVQQDEAVGKIQEAFDILRTDDLREEPHSGYRAVHVIVTVPKGHRVEIQIRTRLQDIYAQLVEAMADRFGIERKYGAGDPFARGIQTAAAQRAFELDLVRHSLDLVESLGDAGPDLDSELRSNLAQAEDRFRAMTSAIIEGLETGDAGRA